MRVSPYINILPKCTIFSGWTFEAKKKKKEKEKKEYKPERVKNKMSFWWYYKA
jgi:hypothetical protein